MDVNRWVGIPDLIVSDRGGQLVSDATVVMGSNGAILTWVLTSLHIDFALIKIDI